ncbi:uncharacterized protein MKZ38_010765 [Zalerion maritima]|uniref:Uncharacterized protein n=1 Tax=Zalerion maritima TaxID=339359 RepID=A0AAD5RZL5_9PEZI|nr:uncharacterized protein MKZ38_010765 [Zalerion maritima]
MMTSESLAPTARQIFRVVCNARALFSPKPSFSVCSACRRTFATTTLLHAGHNKWSKTKHIKKATDAKKTANRTGAAKSIALFSKLYGTNLTYNPKLATAVAEAKKAGVPKANIEQAIARGQGRSSSGDKLEPVTVEAMMPGGIAVMIDLETGSRAKIKGDFLNPLRKNGGSMSSCVYFFDRTGRAVFAAKEGVDADVALEPAIDCGAEDVNVDEEGIITVWCPPTNLSKVTSGMVDALGLNVLDSIIMWNPKEDLQVKLDSTEDAKKIASFLSLITSDIPDLQGIYTNAIQGSISDAEWEAIEEHLD